MELYSKRDEIREIALCLVFVVVDCDSETCIPFPGCPSHANALNSIDSCLSAWGLRLRLGTHLYDVGPSVILLTPSRIKGNITRRILEEPHSIVSLRCRRDALRMALSSTKTETWRFENGEWETRRVSIIFLPFRFPIVLKALLNYNMGIPESYVHSSFKYTSRLVGSRASYHPLPQYRNSKTGSGRSSIRPDSSI